MGQHFSGVAFRQTCDRKSKIFTFLEPRIDRASLSRPMISALQARGQFRRTFFIARPPGEGHERLK
jgi:hypothetical protein